MVVGRAANAARSGRRASRVDLRRGLQPGDGDHRASRAPEVGWRCVGGHHPWQDNDFRFEFSPLGDGRTRVRCWHHYAVELDDDYYGIYNVNWGYYLGSLRPLRANGAGKPFQAAS
jgi:hypothetical protein